MSEEFYDNGDWNYQMTESEINEVKFRTFMEIAAMAKEYQFNKSLKQFADELELIAASKGWM